MIIFGKGKDDYLTGVATRPQKADPKFKECNPENNMVMSWPINLNIEIGEDLMFYGKAKKIYDSANETYSNNKSIEELFEIKVFCMIFDREKISHTIFQYPDILLATVGQVRKAKWELP